MTTHAAVAPSTGFSGAFSASMNWLYDGAIFCGTKVYEGARYGAHAAQPYLHSAGNRIHDLWLKCLPHLHTFAGFLQSPPGVALVLLAATLAFVKLSQVIENKVISNALLLLGVFAGVLAGAILQRIQCMPDSLMCYVAA